MSNQDERTFWICVAVFAFVVFLLASGSDSSGGSQYDYRFDEPQYCVGDRRLGEC